MFDVDFVSELAGARPAAYEASRRAGDPAFMRRMQAGDSLSRAVVGDLALMTHIGGSVGAVAQLPRVRLREVGESFDLVIAVDDAPSLLLPGDLYGKSRKRFAAVGLVSVICGTATRQRGRFSIVALRGSTRVLEIDQFDSEMIEAIFDEIFRDGGSRDTIRNPAELPPTAVPALSSPTSFPALRLSTRHGHRARARPRSMSSIRSKERRSASGAMRGPARSMTAACGRSGRGCACPSARQRHALCSRAIRCHVCRH